MTRSVAVRTYVDINVDLTEIDDDDLVDELAARNKGKAITWNHTPLEQHVATLRYFEQRRKAATDLPPTPAERDFWDKLYGWDL